MSSLFTRRMELIGSSVGGKMKTSSDAIMNKTFSYDKAYSLCTLYDWNGAILRTEEVKFNEATIKTWFGLQTNYTIQFRPTIQPDVEFNNIDNAVGSRMGLYIDIPDDSNIVHRWLIVGRDDKQSFINYQIMKCNYMFKWITNNIIYECLGVFKEGSVGEGIATDAYTTTVDNLTYVYLPTNNKTMLIDYNQRFLIGTNVVNPSAYEVSRKTDMSPIGINKLTVSQCRFDSTKDNGELMIADYYKNVIVPTTPVIVPVVGTSIITGNHIIKANGSFRVLTVKFIDNLGSPIITKTGVWTTNILPENIDKFTIDSSIANTFKIKCNSNLMIGTKILISVADESNGFISTFEMEVQSL